MGWRTMGGVDEIDSKAMIIAAGNYGEPFKSNISQWRLYDLLLQTTQCLRAARCAIYVRVVLTVTRHYSAGPFLLTL